MTAATFRFLDLPAELRLKVYKNISPPLNAPIFNVRGLILAAKSIKCEVEYELIENMRLFLEAIIRSWYTNHGTELRITIPRTLADIEHVSVSIPSSFFKHPKIGTRGAFPKVLRPLLPLRISTLAIKTHDDTPAGRVVQALNHRNFVFFITGLSCHLRMRWEGSEVIRARKFIFRWGKIASVFSGNDIARDLATKAGKDGWRGWDTVLQKDRVTLGFVSQTWTRQVW